MRLSSCSKSAMLREDNLLLQKLLTWGLDASEFDQLWKDSLGPVADAENLMEIVMPAAREFAMLIYAPVVKTMTLSDAFALRGATLFEHKLHCNSHGLKVRNNEWLKVIKRCLLYGEIDYPKHPIRNLYQLNFGSG
ncbi:hypothetical protein Tco_0781854 [Tanacetum coccineum]